MSRLFIILLVTSSYTLCDSWVLSPRNSGRGSSTISRQQATAMFSTKSSQVALSHSLEELSKSLGGRGRAQACWEVLRLGVDPLWYFGSDSEGMNSTENVGVLQSQGWSRQEIQDAMSDVRVENGLGYQAVKLLNTNFVSLETNLASLAKVSVSSDGTTKLLIRLHQDDLEVESVIIPWDDRQKSTLCISSQVGCRQACTFCATGRMGKYRSLTPDEILAQFHWATKVCRLSDIYPIDNIVFMGQGEPADNAAAVVKATNALVDRSRYQMAPRRITISTVAPSPESFQELGEAPVALAWSVHATRDEVRRELVPTTRYTMEELRSGLIQTLQGRTKRLRNTMLEIALIDEINDSKDDAVHLVEFCQPLIQEVKNLKLVVNLIPWNDIGAEIGPASLYRKPKISRVHDFQKVLQDHGILCYIRTTRGDEENAACGMLTTKKTTTSKLLL
eukprot:scaffold22610_cov115-Cylindrotheca_fusiformis.AAC.3